MVVGHPLNFSLSNWTSSLGLEVCNCRKAFTANLESIPHTGMFMQNKQTGSENLRFSVGTLNPLII